MMNAIPTRYAGVQFRSRLEARWAAMFDLLGWTWEYEPIDLDGYIPDFMLALREPVLVEVKPIVQWPKDSGSLVEPSLQLWDAALKIRKSGWDHEAIIVGACLSSDPKFGMEGFWRHIGRFALDYWAHKSKDPTPDCEFSGNCGPSGVQVFTCSKCDRVSFCSDSNSYRCRINGCHDGDSYLGPAPDLTPLWREAGNRVQWRAPEAR